jgi:branched-chain amino acid transport system permease protein
VTRAVRRWWTVDPWSWLLLLAFGLVPMLTANAYYLDTVIFIMLWAAMACCWNLAGGYGGLVSLGHAVFFGIGAYTSTLLYLRSGLSPWLGLLAGVALSVLLALGIGLVSLRLRGPFFSLVTLAFAEVSGIIVTNWRSLTKGAEGLSIPFNPALPNMIFEGKLAYAYLTLGLLVLVYGVSLAIERSPLGYRLLAVREDEDAARALGVRAVRTKTMAFGISAALMAACGTVFAQYVLYIDPASIFSFDLSVQVVLLTVVGGSGRAGGPILGSLLLTPLAQGLRAWLGRTAPGLHLVVYGLLLIVIVLRVPQGLGPTIASWRAALARRPQAVSP